MEKDLSAYYDVVLKWLQYAKQLFMEAKEYCTAYYRYLFLEKVKLNVKVCNKKSSQSTTR